MFEEVTFEAEVKEHRGVGRGSNFFALGRSVWARLWEVPTANRLNLVLAYLVLLAGTGADHRRTKWSARACEDHLGIGKPRAKAAIEELIAAGLVARTPESTSLKPQYLLPELSREEDPIFMPVQIVTGLGRGTPVLRRVRETGDALLLRMLVDLYGLVQLDATYGVPLSCLGEAGGEPSRKVVEAGVHTVWAMQLGTRQNAAGDWVKPHYEKGATAGAEWASFWGRVATLKKIGALWFEAWAFDGESEDAEPIMPVDLGARYNAEPDEIAQLFGFAQEASYALAGERTYVFEKQEADLYLPLAAHQRQPKLRGVAKLSVEPDTPGRRLAFARRMTLVEERTALLRQISDDAGAGRFDRPALAKPLQEVV